MATVYKELYDLYKSGDVVEFEERLSGLASAETREKARKACGGRQGHFTVTKQLVKAWLKNRHLEKDSKDGFVLKVNDDVTAITDGYRALFSKFNFGYEVRDKGDVGFFDASTLYYGLNEVDITIDMQDLIEPMLDKIADNKAKKKMDRHYINKPLVVKTQYGKMAFNPEFLQDGIKAMYSDKVYLKLFSKGFGSSRGYNTPAWIVCDNDTTAYLLLPVNVAHDNYDVEL